MTKKCLHCNKELASWQVKPSWVKKGLAKYCSRTCFALSTRGRDGSWSLGNQYTKGRKHSEDTRRKLSEMRRGEKAPNWKGGVSAENHKMRNGIDYRLWREAVFARDNWTCQECRERGGKLHAHHLKPFAWFPELRFAIDNGVTLCVPCHKRTDDYMNPYFKLSKTFIEIKK